MEYYSTAKTDIYIFPNNKGNSICYIELEIAFKNMAALSSLDNKNTQRKTTGRSQPKC